MNISILKNTNGSFVCLSDVMKIYMERYSVKYNISQSVKNIPDVYIIKGRGRSSKTYLDINIVGMFFNTKRNIPNEFKKEVLSYLGQVSCLPNSHESLFIDILVGFLIGMFSDIKLRRQYPLEGRVFDLLIGNKILLEFDEDYHKYTKDIDIEKNKIGVMNNFKVLRISSNCDYGLEISKIYKMVKNELY